MKQRVIGVALLALLGVTLTGLSPASARDAFKIDQQVGPNAMGLNLVDSFSDTGEGASFLIANTSRGQGAMPDERLCQGFGAAPCDFENGVTLRGAILAPACTTDNQSNCIESLSVYKVGDEPKPAKLIRQSEGEIVPADSAHNLTEGSTKSLWSANQVHTGGSADYVAYVQLALSLDAKKQVHVANLSASVMPVTLVSGSWKPTKYKQGKTPDGREQVSGEGGPSECVWLESNSCGRLQDFAADTRVKLTVRVENTIGGWFKGRMKTPNISVSRFSEDTNVVSFDAEPVSVPKFFAKFDVGGSDEGLKSWLKTMSYAPQNGGVNNSLTDNQSAFNIVQYFRNITRDTSAGVNTLWTAGTVMSGAHPCLADHSKVLGIVTTNAMVYQGNSPEFTNGTLNYKVAGLHYLPDGKTEVEGTYDLVMRSDTARCLYGFTKAPISATIAVTSAEGEAKVATTMMTEKDGWLKLGAYGFTFSSPTISAKLTQVGSTQVLRKATITCAKGKLTKKVTAVGPKCPAGYKKKP